MGAGRQGKQVPSHVLHILLHILLPQKGKPCRVISSPASSPGGDRSPICSVGSERTSPISSLTQCLEVCASTAGRNPTVAVSRLVTAARSARTHLGDTGPTYPYVFSSTFPPAAVWWFMAALMDACGCWLACPLENTNLTNSVLGRKNSRATS